MEDAYTFYVLLLGMSEDLFWNADVAFLAGVRENKTAYEGWRNYAEEKERQRTKRHTRRHR